MSYIHSETLSENQTKPNKITSYKTTKGGLSYPGLLSKRLVFRQGSPLLPSLSSFFPPSLCNILMISLQCVQLLLLTQSDLLEYGISSPLVSVPQFTGHLPRNFPGLISLWISDLFPWSTYLLLKKHYVMKASSSYIAQPSTSWSFIRLCFSLQDSSLTLFSSSFSCPQIDFSLLVALKIV